MQGMSLRMSLVSAALVFVALGHVLDDRRAAQLLALSFAAVMVVAAAVVSVNDIRMRRATRRADASTSGSGTDGPTG